MALHILILEVNTMDHFKARLLTIPGSLVTIDHTDYVFHRRMVILFMEEFSTTLHMILVILKMPQTPLI